MSDFTKPFVAPPTGETIASNGPSLAEFNYLHQTDAQFAGTTTAWTTANQAVYQAIIVQSTVTVTHLGVIVGATSSGNIDVGIYTEGGVKLVSSGSTAVGTISTLQSFDVTDTTLEPGLYWLACAVDNGTATLRGSVVPITNASAATARTRGYMVQTSAFALPATAAFAAPSAAVYVPIVNAYCRTTF